MRFQLLVKHWFSSALITLAVATAGHWFAELTHRMFEYCLEYGFAWNTRDSIIAILLAAVVVITAFFLGRFAKRPLSVVEVSFRSRPALILYLSQSLARSPDLAGLNGEDTEAWREFKIRFPVMVDEFARGLRSPAEPKDAAAAFGAENWCMPFISIANHALSQNKKDTLRHLVVVCSQDSVNRKNGSWRQAAFFQEMVERFFRVWGAPHVCPEIQIPFESGVNFYDLETLSAAIRDCYEQLAARGISNAIVDVTGGTKECSIAGAALALEPGRVFQYVVEGRVLKQYDLTYSQMQHASHGGH